jgi:hypothetical protein
MAKISVKALVIAGVVDIVASSIVIIPVAIFAMMSIDRTGLTPEQLQAATLTAIKTNKLLYMIQYVLGTACSMFAGYLAGRIAKHDYVLHGALSAWLCISLGVYAVTAKGNMSALLDIALAPAVGAFGGYLMLKQASRRAV